MKRFRSSVAVTCVLFVGCAIALSTTVISGPTTRSVEAAELKSAAFREALLGRFDDALKNLGASARLAPQDETTPAAMKLLQQHQTRERQWESQRHAEYDEAVQRIGLAMLAESYQHRLAQAKLLKPMRKKVRTLIAAYARIDSSEVLTDANSTDAADAKKLKTEAIEAIDESVEKLKETSALLKLDSSKYAKTFRQISLTLGEKLTRYKQAWSSGELDSNAGRKAAAKKISDLEDGLADALIDVETMLTTKPWRTALSQARVLLKHIAAEADKPTSHQWFGDLVVEIEKIAAEAVTDARWYDANLAYDGLAALDPNNDFYIEQLKVVRRHVRVLGLYGRDNRHYDTYDNDPDDPLNQTDPNQPQDIQLDGPRSDANQPPQEEDILPLWQGRFAGVDADMVKRAITEMNRHYVSRTIDYRKLLRGALTSVRLLAETPQAARSFALLGDDDKRNAFIEAIDNIQDQIDKQDRIGHLQLAYALNSVLDASDRTVQIPTNVLAVEFAEGFIRELDKFSSMIWPKAVLGFQKDTRGNFIGVGIQITKRPDESLRVVMPLPDSPALREGIQVNDVILEVDGKATKNLTIDKLVDMIMGPKGAKVVLLIKREGWIKPREMPIIRDQIHVRTIKGWRRQPDGEWDYMIDPNAGIAYIRLTQFTEETVRDLSHALDELQEAKVTSLVLDLRDNRGGLLSAATGVANEFLDGKKIVSTKGRMPNRPPYIAGKGGGYLKGNMVVLVNELSASAAEIVSGALNDWDRSLIVGRRTFGKGSVQHVIPIPRHTALLRLTTAHYYLPKGRLPDRKNGSADWGVNPDINVLITPKQLRRWWDIRRQTDLLKKVDPNELRDQLAEQLDADVQLNTALLLLRLMRLQKT